MEKIYVSNIYREHLLCPQSNASSSFLQPCINSVEQRLKFSQFEGSIIPQYIRGRGNNWDPVCKFAKFPFTEPIK